MSANIENTLSSYEKRILDKYYGLCSDCNQPKNFITWCQNCSSKRFKQEFSKWTSGNEQIDKFIQDTQLKARNIDEIIEWIPYNRLRNIQYLAKGGFSTFYKAIWLDGPIRKWIINIKHKQRKSSSHSPKNEGYENAKDEDIKLPLNESKEFGIRVMLKSL